MKYYLVQFETPFKGVWHTDKQEDETRNTEDEAREVALAGLREGRGERATINYIEVIDQIVMKENTR